MSERSDQSTPPEQHDDDYWRDFGRAIGQAFAAGMAAEHQATQEAEAEKHLGDARYGTQVLIGTCLEVDGDLREMRVNTGLGSDVWAFYGHGLTEKTAREMASRRRRVRLTVPVGRQGTRRAFFSGEMVDPQSED